MKSDEFSQTFRPAFRLILGAGTAVFAVVLIIGAVGGSPMIWAMLVLDVLFALSILMFLTTNAYQVRLADGRLHVRTGVGRVFIAPLYDVECKMRPGAGRNSWQLVLRMPGQRYGVTVPKYPGAESLALLGQLEDARPGMTHPAGGQSSV